MIKPYKVLVVLSHHLSVIAVDKEAISWPTPSPPASLISQAQFVLQVIYLRLHLSHLGHECIESLRIR